ncbi:aromatic amino acid lyase [Escherichia coli]|nr:aromatic amino acid lyase [Escherichia coli]RXB00492.1 aromatic amino acid lyase [Escherichia coli]TEV16914.1 aromatic amino acid lyase [Escherichia coli]TEV51363.1 aromatic amino acid lyase [Escherichia coli]TEV98326.1 aromatic amino acid lyase [Escherichia coli]
MAKSTITLDGEHLSIDQAWSIALGDNGVKIASNAMERMEKSYDLVMTAAHSGTPVYGLTVGVGLNKDQPIFDAKGNLTPEVIDASKKFNAAALRAHSAGVGPMLPDYLARLSMVLRLNTMLHGQTGAQPYIAELYAEFINRGVTPLIPVRGSIGAADIMLASHVGLVMMGEWKARVNGVQMSGGDALAKVGLKPLVPQGKDMLAILSNNSVGTAYAIEAVRSARQLLNVSPVVFAMSLEALNGNVAPVLPQSIAVRPFPQLADSAKEIRDALSGSYLWHKHDKRALQDPLSFRTMVYTISEAMRALRDAEDTITVQINSSDDNPATVLNADKAYQDSSQVAQYFVKDGAISGGIFPTANFESLPVALATQRLTVALVHVSHNSMRRSLHLEDDHFTGLSRFLSAAGNKGHGFGSLHIPFVALHAENVDLANPVSFDIQPVAGGIEDTGANNDHAARRLKQVVDNLNVIYGIELMHSAQALDLRLQADPQLALGKSTKAMFTEYRKVVPFVDQDRVFTPDIAASQKFLEGYAINQK